MLFYQCCSITHYALLWSNPRTRGGTRNGTSTEPLTVYGHPCSAWSGCLERRHPVLFHCITWPELFHVLRRLKTSAEPLTVNGHPCSAWSGCLECRHPVITSHGLNCFMRAMTRRVECKQSAKSVSRMCCTVRWHCGHMYRNAPTIYTLHAFMSVKSSSTPPATANSDILSFPASVRPFVHTQVPRVTSSMHLKTCFHSPA